MRQDIEDRVQSVMNQAFEYGMKYEMYNYLWEEDKGEFLKQFLKYGHQLTPQELEAKSAGEEPLEQPATMDQFKEMVDTMHENFCFSQYYNEEWFVKYLCM